MRHWIQVVCIILMLQCARIVSGSTKASDVVSILFHGCAVPGLQHNPRILLSFLNSGQSVINSAKLIVVTGDGQTSPTLLAPLTQGINPRVSIDAPRNGNGVSVITVSILSSTGELYTLEAFVCDWIPAEFLPTQIDLRGHPVQGKDCGVWCWCLALYTAAVVLSGVILTILSVQRAWEHPRQRRFGSYRGSREFIPPVNYPIEWARLFDKNSQYVSPAANSSEVKYVFDGAVARLLRRGPVC